MTKNSEGSCPHGPGVVEYDRLSEWLGAGRERLGGLCFCDLFDEETSQLLDGIRLELNRVGLDEGVSHAERTASRRQVGDLLRMLGEVLLEQPVMGTDDVVRLTGEETKRFLGI